MRNNWKTYKLSEVAEIKYGKDHKLLSDGDIPVFGSGGIMRYADKAIYDKESILIPRKGTLSNLFYLDKPFWSVDTMFYTKISEGTSGKFLYYLLKNLNLASMNVGSAVPSLTTEVLNKVEINLPLEVNNSAVALLGDETLKHIAQELLQTVRNSTTIDWTIKESVQSALRRNVRRILRLHGYPPDLQEKAVETVITQAKMLAENLLSDKSE